MYISKKALRRQFDPCLYPDQTYLLCKLQWCGSDRVWIHWVRNDVYHAEEYFLQDIFEPRNYGFCHITWYLSWSPCWSCCDKIREFLRRHPNVSIDIHVARLFYSDNERNRRGLRELDGLQRVTIQVMEARDYYNCWETFIQRGVYYDFSPRNFEPAIRRYRSMLENILTVEKGNNITKEKLSVQFFSFGFQGSSFIESITEYLKLKGTQKDHQVQVPSPRRTA